MTTTYVVNIDVSYHIRFFVKPANKTFIVKDWSRKFETRTTWNSNCTMWNSLLFKELVRVKGTSLHNIYFFSLEIIIQSKNSIFRSSSSGMKSIFKKVGSIVNQYFLFKFSTHLKITSSTSNIIVKIKHSAFFILVIIYSLLRAHALSTSRQLYCDRRIIANTKYM